MVKLIIIADDYTGALDTGVQFSKSSIGTLVTLWGNLNFNEIHESIQVVVVSTESRHVSKEIAALRVRGVGIKALEHGVQFFYKKTDSAMRGNIGSELVAIADAVGANELMFIPAYPDANRTTKKGCQFVNGVPIDETTYARDPIDPVTSSYIPDIIRLQEEIKVVALSKEVQGSISMENDERTIYVFDSESNIDLSNIAKILKKQNKLRLTAGCAGFAKTLLEVLDVQSNNNEEKCLISGRMLTVSGSLNEISLEQIRIAEANDFNSVTLKPQHKLQKDFFKTQAVKDLISGIVEMIEKGKNIIIKTVDSISDKDACRKYAKDMGIDEGTIPFLISQNFGSLIKEITNVMQLGTLVVFGGDTTLEIVNELQISGIIPKEEIMPGVVLSEPLGKGRKFNLITKSGGLGDKDVLIKIKEYMAKYQGALT